VSRTLRAARSQCKHCSTASETGRLPSMEDRGHTDRPRSHATPTRALLRPRPLPTTARCVFQGNRQHAAVYSLLACVAHTLILTHDLQFHLLRSMVVTHTHAKIIVKLSIVSKNRLKTNKHKQMDGQTRPEFKKTCATTQNKKA